MRPHKPRFVKCDTRERCFGPLKQEIRSQDIIFLRVDEFEAVRLRYVEGLKQESAAKRMNISRPTLSRILSSAIDIRKSNILIAKADQKHEYKNAATKKNI